MAQKILSLCAESFGTPETRITIDGHEIIIDEPKAFGGSDLAPSPVAFLLASIAGCISAIGYWKAHEMGLKLDYLGIKVDGSIDSAGFFGESSDIRSGFSAIEIKIDLTANWSQEDKEIWLEAVKRRCPVVDNIANETEIKINF